MAKYDPLFRHLCTTADGPVTMTFAEIGAMVGPLPGVASQQRSWWRNDPDGGHAQAKAWLNAGREVETVDPDRGTVRFSVPGWRRGS